MTTYTAARLFARPTRPLPRSAPHPHITSPASRLLRFGVAMAVLLAGASFPRSAFFTVTGVVVTGAQHIAAADLVARSGVRPGMPLAGIRPEVIAARLRHPRIARIHVHVSPTGLVRIRVSERVPHAALPFRDRVLVLDHTGVVIERTTQPGRLPVVIVDGAVIPWVREGDRIATAGVRRTLDVLHLLPAAELARGAGIRMSPAGELQVMTADGIQVLLGQPHGLATRAAMLSQVLAAIRRQRLVPATLDLRYSGSVIVRPGRTGRSP